MFRFLILFALPSFVTAQDSLKKYSYLVYGQSNSNVSSLHTGTGSFLKKGNKVYFLSSNHVFSGFDSEAKKIEDYPDTLYINLKEKKSNKKVKYAVDIREYKKRNQATYNFNFQIL